jgi:protein TonB
MPLRDEGRRAGAVVSVLVHALVIALLVIPFFLPTSVIARMQQGAGGAGPAGGGGGGRLGTGGTVETLHFVRIAPDPPRAPTTKPAVAPPIPKIAPPLPTPRPVVTPPAQKPEQQSVVPAPATTVAAVTPGTNGGSGRDGTSGAGPGSGGGVGSGVGPGRGSANGPGTGGGNQANYPPTVVDMNLPPMPAPKEVRGMTVIAEFDVDSTGRVLDFKFTETPDGSYNRLIASALRTTKFRPGTRPDGTPLRMKAQISIAF